MIARVGRKRSADLIRIAAVVTSAMVAWQAVRFYRKEVALPVLDQFVAMFLHHGSWPPLLALIQTMAGMIVFLALTQLILQLGTAWSWRIELGREGFAERGAERAALRAAAEARSVSQADPAVDTASKPELSWTGALLLTPLTLGCVGIAITLVIAVVAKADEVRAGLGIPWSTIADVALGFVVGLMWMAMAAQCISDVIDRKER